MERIDEFEEVRRQVSDVGEDRAENTRELYKTVDEALEQYREDATGHGDFGKYVEFQNVVIASEEKLDDRDVYQKDDFESALSRLDARTLQDKHFRRARKDLSDVRGLVESYDRYEELRDELRDELSRLERRLDGIEDEIKEKEEVLERVENAEETDASVLRDAVEGYNQRVRREFKEFVKEAPAVDVARLGERTLDAPLVENAAVERGTAERLARYVDDETVDRVLELADASDGKLSHYFDNPEGFRDAVPRTFFETLDTEPFEISYGSEGVVRRRVPELVSVVDTFADEETVAALRRVRDIAANDNYDEMRRALVAREDTGEDAEALRERLTALRDEKEDVKERVEELHGVLND